METFLVFQTKIKMWGPSPLRCDFSHIFQHISPLGGYFVWGGLLNSWTRIKIATKEKSKCACFCCFSERSVLTWRLWWSRTAASFTSPTPTIHNSFGSSLGHLSKIYFDFVGEENTSNSVGYFTSNAAFWGDTGPSLFRPRHCRTNMLMVHQQRKLRNNGVKLGFTLLLHMFQLCSNRI